MGLSERYPAERNEETPEKMERNVHVMITEVHQDRRFYRLSTGRAAHLKILNHITHPQKIGVNLETWSRAII